MKLKTLTLSAALVLTTAAAAFASCNGKHRISCAEGFIFDASKGGCVSMDVTS